MEKMGYWLTPWERERVIKGLIKYGLLKWDNGRSLPLKSGGKTDIYINLRDARKNPKALDFVSAQYVNPITRLNPSRFIEVPDSVSCFAPLISVKTGIPYITIREQAKTGRVAKASTIGETGSFGESLCMVDDVVTDGASKIIPNKECLRMLPEEITLVVLVDRQQGWQEKFKEEGISMPVWAGMTLHDVRRYLIENGIMERCDRALEAENPLIIGLDGKSWDEILPYIDVLRTSGCILKVNDLLMNKGIENLIPDLQVYGRVMADLKENDIPNTVKNITKHLLPYPPWAVTVHANGSEEMVRAAVKNLEGTATKVLAVTVLTSIDPKTCKEIYTRLPREQVRALARIGYRAGAHGFVCSAEEVAELKKDYPKAVFVVPGTRSEGVDKGDQKRSGTPAKAMEDGADYLVMARQILDAPNPVAEVMRVLKEELGRFNQ
jgi:orotidine-5'-phosphate decarboxylase